MVLHVESFQVLVASGYSRQEDAASENRRAGEGGVWGPGTLLGRRPLQGGCGRGSSLKRAIQALRKRKLFLADSCLLKEPKALAKTRGASAFALRQATVAPPSAFEVQKNRWPASSEPLP